MKRKMTFFLMLTFFLTAVTSFVLVDFNKVEAAAAINKVNYSDCTVTASKLNLRQGPSTGYKVIETVAKGQTLKVLGKVGNWLAVYDPKKGCVGAVDSKYVKTSMTTADAGNDEASVVTAATPTDVTADEQALLELVNKARAEAGVKSLAFDKNLLNVARKKANDMAENSYFSHQSPTYGSPFDMMRQFNLSFKSAGENIAGNQTVEGAFKAWMSSDGHKKNILNDNFNYIGVGIAESKTYGKILVQQFIGR